jgi:hypothetical protein
MGVTEFVQNRQCPLPGLPGGAGLGGGVVGVAEVAERVCLGPQITVVM